MTPPLSSDGNKVECGTDDETSPLTNDERVALLHRLYDALLISLLAALAPADGHPTPPAAYLDIARKVLTDHGIRASAMRTTGEVRRGLDALVADLGTLPFGKNDKAK